jgi:hypothetical protein
MTTQLAVMNKTAVILASDSLASSQSYGKDDGIVIRQSNVNKIFNVLDGKPVAAMLSGNAGINGVHWETVFGNYKARHKDKKYERLNDFADHFFKYIIEESPKMFSMKSQENYIAGWVPYFVQRYVLGVTERLKIENSSDEEIHKAFLSDEHLTLYVEWLQDKLSKMTDIAPVKEIPAIRDEVFEILKGKYKDFFDKKMENNSFSQKNITNLAAISSQMIFKEQLSEGYSNSQIVFAGYGEEEIFPRLITFNVAGFYKGILDYRKEYDRRITLEDESGDYLPVAQSLVAEMFKDGTSVDHKDFQKRLMDDARKTMENKISEVIRKSTIRLSGEMGNLDKEQYEKILNKCNKVFEACYKELISSNSHIFENINVQTAQYCDEMYNHIKKSLHRFSFEEMVTLAETLLKLNVLSSQIYAPEQAYISVGGPIKIISLSKGDGYREIETSGGHIR